MSFQWICTLYNVNVEVESNTFGEAYGGILAGCEMSKTPSITNNIFNTGSYGVDYINLTNPVPCVAYIADNVLNTPSFGVNLSGNAEIVDNTFKDCGSTAINVQRGNPEIKGNAFLPSISPQYGAISAHNYAAPRLRDNSFVLHPGPALVVSGGAGTPLAQVPDLGTAMDPGNNNFKSITGTIIDHQTPLEMPAVGNFWPTAQPACGSEVTVSNGATVKWGPDANDVCQ